MKLQFIFLGLVFLLLSFNILCIVLSYHQPINNDVVQVRTPEYMKDFYTCMPTPLDSKLDDRCG